MSPRNHRHRGFFMIFFGSRNLISNDGQSVGIVCPRCRKQSNILGKTYQQWFTLFFCPIFPIGSRKHFSECPNCKAQFKATIDQLRQSASASQQQQAQQGITMYNSMRASPANSVTLNDLMMLYASLSEFDQAVSAARDFPQALNNSEQCMTTLGRVLLEQNKRAEAVQWFDAALARNPAHAEAAYYKAITLMGMTPPDFQGAVAAARIARSGGFPNAEGLLKEIENRSRIA